jgi:hypothetical protein
MVETILGLVKFTPSGEKSNFSDKYLIKIGKKTIAYFPEGLLDGCELIGKEKYDARHIVKLYGIGYDNEIHEADFVDVEPLMKILRRYDNGRCYRIAGLVEGSLIIDGLLIGGYAPGKIVVASLRDGLSYMQMDSLYLARTTTLADELGHSFGLRHPHEVLKQAKISAPPIDLPTAAPWHENLCLMLFNSAHFCSCCQKKLERFVEVKENLKSFSQRKMDFYSGIEANSNSSKPL